MAIIRTDKIYSGTLTAVETVIGTIETGKTFVLHGFNVSNSNASTKKFSMKINDIRIVTDRTIPTGDSIILSNLNIPVLAGSTIKMKAEVGLDLDYLLWGIEEEEVL